MNARSKLLNQRSMTKKPGRPGGNRIPENEFLEKLEEGGKKETGHSEERQDGRSWM